MRLTDYSTLCIDAHGVLIDRDTAILDGLRPLLSRLDSPPPAPDQIMQEYLTLLHTVGDERMGLMATHCTVYRALATAWGLEVDWREIVDFADSLGTGSLYEDCPGAIQYLRKFYRLRVVTTLSEEEFAPFDLRIGLDAAERLALGSFAAARERLRVFAADPQVLLLSAAPPPAGAKAGYCRFQRTLADSTRPEPGIFVTLTGFIRAHQRVLRLQASER